MPPRPRCRRSKGHRGPVLVVYRRCAADHDGHAAAPGRGLPQGQGRRRRAGLRRQRSVALRPADRARRHAGADRREPRCRCGREGDRLLQFRRHVPRRRADRLAAGRDQGRQRQERVLSHRRGRRGPRRRPRRDRRRRRRGGVPGHQFARRARGGGEGPAAAPARGCVRGRRQHGRSRHGVARRRHEVRGRRHDRPQRALRPRRKRGVRNGDQGLLRHRGRPHRPRRHHRPVRPHPAGLGRRRPGPYRQLRRAQGHPHGPRRQGQPPGLSRRLRHRRGQQHRRRHHRRELRRLRQVAHRDRRRGLRRLQQLAGRAGEDRPRRQRDGGQRRHRGRAGRRAWPSAVPARRQRRGGRRRFVRN